MALYAQSGRIENWRETSSVRRMEGNDWIVVYESFFGRFINDCLNEVGFG